jgi:hypothetical protein
MTGILRHGVVWGVVLAAALFPLVLLILRVNPEMMLNDYPPDVRARWGPISAGARRQRTWFALPIIAVLVGILWWSGRSLSGLVEGPLSFGPAFLHFAFLLGTFNFLDLVVLDIPLVYFQPRFIVLPGTEGMAGYRDYGFHVRGFLIGVAVAILGAAVCATVAVLT